MDGGAWWAAVHGAAKSRTRLSDFTFTFHFHALEKEMVTHSSVLAWRIPGMGKPGGLPSMGSHRVGHDWSDLAAARRLNQSTLELISFFLCVLELNYQEYWLHFPAYFVCTKVQATMMSNLLHCKLHKDWLICSSVGAQGARCMNA